MTTNNIKTPTLSTIIIALPSLVFISYINFYAKSSVQHTSEDGTALNYDKTYELFYSKDDPNIVYLNGTIYKYISPDEILICTVNKSDCSNAKGLPKAFRSYFAQKNTK